MHMQPLLKQLQRHILAQLPGAKIESTRFRSIPFQAPTSKLPASDDEGAAASKPKTPAPAKQGRAHDRERASTWRERKEAEEEEEIVKNDEKKFLNPGQKKKIAFINQEFHSTADTANAYVVFAHPLPAEHRPSNLPPPPPTMDPYEAAQLAAEKCDGTVFMDRMIRVDLVNKKGLGGDTKPFPHQGATDTDPKLSVFVGNLDFASKEEDLRVFFEGVVSAERGPPEVDSDEEGDNSVTKPNSWVTRVRIVRDKETQLGKGFAYVQFVVSR
jgi:nucleolar protein 12